jgi:hypothetical protein
MINENEKESLGAVIIKCYPTRGVIEAERSQHLGGIVLLSIAVE